MDVSDSPSPVGLQEIGPPLRKIIANNRLKYEHEYEAKFWKIDRHHAQRRGQSIVTVCSRARVGWGGCVAVPRRGGLGDRLPGGRRRRRRRRPARGAGSGGVRPEVTRGAATACRSRGGVAVRLTHQSVAGLLDSFAAMWA